MVTTILRLPAVKADSGYSPHSGDRLRGRWQLEKWQLYGMKIDAAAVSRDVNGKITYQATHGKPESGYLYTLQWYNESPEHDVIESTLEYASAKPDSMALTDMILFANKIDKETK